MSLRNISADVAEFWIENLVARGEDRALAVKVVLFLDGRDVRVRGQWQQHYQLPNPVSVDERVYDFRIDFDSDMDRMDELWIGRARGARCGRSRCVRGPQAVEA